MLMFVLGQVLCFLVAAQAECVAWQLRRAHIVCQSPIAVPHLLKQVQES